MTQARLIFNPNAGRFAPGAAAARAAEVLTAHGWTVDIQRTHSAEHVEQLARQAAEEGLDSLIVAGGDGSIGRTIAGLRGSETSLAVLPTGTANVWAKQLGLPMLHPNNVRAGVTAIAESIAASEAKRMDIGICNHKPFLLWAGIGFDAMIVEQSEQKRSHLKKYFAIPEYIVRAVWAAGRWPGLPLKISGINRDGLPINFEGTAQISVVSNIPLYGGGLTTISPDARINDGEMDLWIFFGKGAGRALLHAWHLLRGSHIGRSDAVRIPFTKIEISPAVRAHVQSDGDPMMVTDHVRIEVEQQSLKILTPSEVVERLFE